MVCNNGNVTFYVDGVRENFAIGTSYDYSTTSFQVDSDLSAIGRIIVGRSSAGGYSTASRRGPVRLSNFARYASNYTPQPF